jgi:hypothetical protein
MPSSFRVLAGATAFFGASSMCVVVAGAVVAGDPEGTGSLTTPAPTGGFYGSGAGPGATNGGPFIASATLSLYERAALDCPGLPWTVLAAIGTVESSNGTSSLPGVHSGANYAGAEGPMQFEPGTFAEYDLPVPPGGAAPPSPYDPADAVYAAARLLCANGAAGGADLPAAVFAYNHSTAYVAEVLSIARSL